MPSDKNNNCIVSLRAIMDFPKKSCRRVFRNTSLNASITVETALVLPIFMFAMISILYFSEVFRYSDCVLAAMHQSVRSMAVKAYAVNKLGDMEVADMVGKLSGVAISETYVRGEVSKGLQRAGVKERNISYLRSSIMENDIIDVVAEEEIEIPYAFIGIPKFRITDRARVHAFTGYDNSLNNKNDMQEEVVFVTDTGSVYHSSRSCSHLKVTIKDYPANQADKLRNSSGGKYYPCEYCKGKAGGRIYLTNFGDRYHSSVSCQALKRSVQAIPKSKINLPPCKDCN